MSDDKEEGVMGERESKKTAKREIDMLSTHCQVIRP